MLSIKSHWSWYELKIDKIALKNEEREKQEKIEQRTENVSDGGERRESNFMSYNESRALM